jgi:hypothetical protein
MPGVVTGAAVSQHCKPVEQARRVWLCLLIAVMVVALSPIRATAVPDPVTPASPKVIQVSAGDTHTCVLKLGGDVACWGWQGGETPAEVKGPFTSISAGAFHNCAVKPDRSVACWGGGAGPVTVPGEFKSVSAGNDYSCAIEMDADLVCWGNNGAGQAPPHVTGPFLSVDSGGAHTCAIKSDETITCWGSNESGQAPPQVAGSFTSVSAGPSSTCGLHTDATVSCWGDNSRGQAPPKVPGSFTSVSVGHEHACALRTNGNALCWHIPEEIVGPFRSITAGGHHDCAIRAGDLLSCWGNPDLMPSPPAHLYPEPFFAATEGSPFEHTFYVSTTSSARLAVRGTMPAGLKISPEDMVFDQYTEFVLSGVPRKRGTYRLTFVATNLFGVSTAQITLRVLPPPGFDVNADGVPDLPVGAAGEDHGKTVDAGRVTVLLGSPDGTYGRAGAVLISQETIGQRSERGDRFGGAIATGEVDGDNFVDLIIGVPGENRGAGQVVVVHGSATGLAGARRTVLRQGLAGAAGTAERGDGFGSAVSVGDGLWVGAPGEDLGSARDAGVVTRFPIAPLRTAGSVQYRQGARKVPGQPESGDRFGAALAGGGSLIGVPGENLGRIADAGLVTWKLTRALTQDSADVPGTVERGDRFGAAVASTTVWALDNVHGDWVSFDVIAVGAPGEDLGTRKDAGLVTLAYDHGYLFDTPRPFESVAQDTWSPSQKVESGDRFGEAVALAADATRLIIGAPGEDVNGSRDAGAVTVLSVGRGCSEGCGAGVQAGFTLEQGKAGVPGSPHAGSLFGATVAERPGVGGGYVVGAPGARVNGHPAGGAVIITPDGGAARQLTENSPGVPGTAEKGDRFGTLPRP